MIRQGVGAIREMYGLTRGLGNLRVMLGSGLLGMAASGLLNPVMPLYLRERGLGFQEIGALYTVGALLPIFVQPVLGALSDRHGRKPFVVGLSLVTSLMVPAVALVDDPQPLAAVMILKMLLSRSAAPVSNAMVADFAPAKQRATLFSLLDATSNLVFVAALFASSAVIRALSVAGTFFLAGGLFLAGSLLLLGLDEPARPERAEAGRGGAAWGLVFRGLWSPFTYVKDRPGAAALFLWQFFFTFALALFPTYLPLYAVELGAPREAVGPLVAASWLTYAFAQPFGGRLSDRLARRVGLIVPGLAGMAVLAAVLGASGWLPHGAALVTLVAAWVLLAIPDGLHRSSASALVVEQSPGPSERGRFMGALGACAALASVLAPVTYGFVAQAAGIGCTFLLSSVSLVLALGCVSRVREASSPVTPEPAPMAALTPTSEHG
ncbi:MFS transporter [Corallococcus sp. AB049A]|uniref:MFS transporter n=1 Tax=Corallococcus interemptor TaxID=2316720 RepID=A0A3A8QGG4_9BACT|nr:MULTISPECIES: MFS transporter [Corallococcus]RKH62304.1 MFS transporter [Corallococcus interemptor]RKI53811.1 MFS transporter [Corallococcus sp. AB049A]